MSALLRAMSALAAGTGVALLLDGAPWFRRRPLAGRLAPYRLGHPAVRPPRLFDRRTALELARACGDALARTAGATEPAAVRLERVHSALDASSFRARQLGWAIAALGSGLAVSVAGRPPMALVGLLVIGSPVLAFLVVEQQLASASERWQRRLQLELPVVTEQLASLVAAGSSLGAAIGRLATRGRGACAADLTRVRARVHQGLSVTEALREWSDLARLAVLDRLVAVLALNQEAPDLGRLLAEEARSMRREAHRELLATIERRGQQVWIPVTVATLVPGVVFLAVPFVAALRLFSGT